MKTIKIMMSAGLLIICLGLSSAHGQAVYNTLVSLANTNGPDYGDYFEAPRCGALVLGPDGNFYGTTPNGGFSDTPFDRGFFGTVFKMTPSGSFSSLYFFGSVSNSLTQEYGLQYYGQNPTGNLIVGSDGNLYGTSPYGGEYNAGSIFEITTDGYLATLYSFGSQAVYDRELGWTNFDGQAPWAGLIQGQDGNFYGTTAGYGLYGVGTVFKMIPGVGLTTLHSFNAPAGEGANPIAELIQGPDGALYGTTRWGGPPGHPEGTIFRITTDGNFSTLYAFTNGLDGGVPTPGLTLGRDGSLYGGTASAVFKITTNGTFTVVHQFNLNLEGNDPLAAFLLGSDGNFYGTTIQGGYWGIGSVFQMTPAGAVTILHAFNPLLPGEGWDVVGGLTQGPDGSFYGTTSAGGGTTTYEGSVSGSGDYGYGTIFHLVIRPQFQTIARTNGVVTLAWKAIPNQTCQVQYTTDLSSASWTNLGDHIGVTNCTVTAIDSGASDQQRFYRIQLVGAP